jgi:hypothetical protein
VSDDEKSVTLPLADLQILFDTAVGSMDWGSGFLDAEEVEALRRVAIILGVDPLDATPDNHKCQYRGQHRWIVNYYGDTTGHEHCADCKAVRKVS